MRKLVDRARRSWIERTFPVDTFKGVYGSFAEAEAAAPRHKRLGYDGPGPASYYRDKLDRVHHDDYPALFWLDRLLPETRSVLEIGGHVGVAFYGFERYLSYPSGLAWTICDVPAVAQAGAELARERGRDELRFVTRLDDSEGGDVLLAAGSLQYLEEPLAPALERLRRRPRHLLLNKTPVWDGPGFVTLQNIGEAYCPYRIFHRSELVDPLLAMGYELVDTWNKPRAFRIQDRPRHRFDHYTGFYLRAR